MRVRYAENSGNRNGKEWKSQGNMAASAMETRYNGTNDDA